MGNKCQCMCGTDEDGKLRPCYKKPKRGKNSRENVLPGDLHSGGGHTSSGTGHSNTGLQRPGTLNVSATNYGNTNRDATSKFPAFSLHGVQKTSPTLASATTTPGQADSSQMPMESFDLQKVESLFEHYCDDAEAQEILADGTEKLCQDLEVDPTEFIVLALAWKFKASTMCRFTKKEFVGGFMTLQCSSISSLKSALKLVETEALSNFKELYRYTFQFALDAEQGQRSLPCDIAIAMWNVVFSRNPPSLLSSWIDYLTENNVRGISRDTWSMFLYLTESLKDDLSNYNDTEAWPSLFDDFVEYQKQKNVEAEAARQLAAEAEKSFTPPESPKHGSGSDPALDTPRHSSSENIPPASAAAGESGSSEKISVAEVPGMIASSSETTPQLRDSNPGEPFGASQDEEWQPALPRVPSSPGEILSHLHSEREDSAAAEDRNKSTVA